MHTLCTYGQQRVVVKELCLYARTSPAKRLADINRGQQADQVEAVGNRIESSSKRSIHVERRRRQQALDCPGLSGALHVLRVEAE
jgi:hypothetical protein